MDEDGCEPPKQLVDRSIGSLAHKRMRIIYNTFCLPFTGNFVAYIQLL